MAEYARHEVVLDLRNPQAFASEVTVIVTLYNYMRYIEAALQSVLEQTHQGLNLIVVDDKSKDRSLSVAKRWMTKHASRFGRAMLLLAESNYGLAVSRNAAFSRAETDHVFVLDADNALYPLAVERLLQACNNAGADAAYSLIEMFGDQAGIGESYVWDPNRFALHNYVDAMALIRKDAWEKAGVTLCFRPAAGKTTTSGVPSSTAAWKGSLSRRSSADIACLAVPCSARKPIKRRRARSWRCLFAIHG